MDPSLTNIIKGKLELKLISGQNLGHLIDSEVNQHFVYIELEVVDMDPNSRKGIKKSTVVQYNLFHPVWQDQPKFSFDIEYLDCSILFLRVVSILILRLSKPKMAWSSGVLQCLSIL